MLLTPEQLEKALIRCSKKNNILHCVGCPLIILKCHNEKDCIETLCKNALYHINRLTSKNRALSAEVKVWQKLYDDQVKEKEINP